MLLRSTLALTARVARRSPPLFSSYQHSLYEHHEMRKTDIKKPFANAEDTNELIDHVLLASAGEPAWLFFDIDETLLMRDTNFVHGFKKTAQLLKQLGNRLNELKVGRSQEILTCIMAEMEKAYYGSDISLVDPLLARLVRGLKLQGHKVFGLTSNAPTSNHSMKIVAALSKYKIRFSVPEIRGELPYSGALVMDHNIINGIIFADNRQKSLRDKGEIMSEFVDLSLKCERSRSSGTKMEAGSLKDQVCILVDNTQNKCEKAVSTFYRKSQRHSLDLKVIHFTQAEAAIDHGLFAAQFHSIVESLLHKNIIDQNLAVEFREASSSICT